MSISLVPSTLKEASLDTPTFRGTVLHYNEQVDLVEKWLESFIKASSKLVSEILNFEDVVNTFLQRAVPTTLSETIIDHDYTLLAMQKYVEGSRGFWGNIIVGAKKVDRTMLEPLLAFQRQELRNFKETRRLLEATQSKYDALLARYLSQSKSKEPSALREDAFQMYEARKAYFKQCFDFCAAAPALRVALDRTLTKVISDLWREQVLLRKETTGVVERCRTDLERIRTWSDSMESSAALFRKQLGSARKELEERVKKESQPGRELEEYSVSTVPYLTSKGGAAPIADNVPSEKQGWLYLKTFTGKPTRTVWVRRWFFIKSGIFGWLVQGYRNGGVEESEKVGVLLCNIKPAFQEDRRFCFEVKTKDTSVLLQAETQTSLTCWLAVFEQAKRTAVESSSINQSTQAFSIIPPSAPAPPLEPAYITKGHDGNSAGVSLSSGDGVPPLLLPRGLRREGRGSTDDEALSFERSFTLGPGIGAGVGPTSRAPSIDTTRLDISTISPPSATKEKFGSRLDLHRKSTSNAGDRSNSGAGSASPASTGISALIAASHSMLQLQPAEAVKVVTKDAPKHNTLAPLTLVGTPAPTNLMTAATLTSGGTPAFTSIRQIEAAGSKSHRRTMSLDFQGKVQEVEKGEVAPNSGDTVDYPPNYPPALKLQDDHFRILFPGRWDEVVLMVFRATWSPNDTQELPGRCFVTGENFYFYAHYMGLVFQYITPLASITEVRAVPERENDYVFLHLRPDAEEAKTDKHSKDERITLKVFLEPLRLLHRRLHFLVRNANSGEDDDPPTLYTTKLLPRLVDMEKEVDEKGTDTESWEDLGMMLEASEEIVRRREGAEELAIRIDHAHTSHHADSRARDAPKLKLPPTPVVYAPEEVKGSPLERVFEVPAQALFHVIVGDLSPLFQALYAERRAQNIEQGAWEDIENGKLRRQFSYSVNFLDFLGRSRKADVVDHQTIEKRDEHLCYVIKDVKTPWHLPHRQDFVLISKIVITHVAQTKCKLSIWTHVDWSREPRFSKSIVESQALDDLMNDALDLGDVAAEQIRKLGPTSRIKRAIQLFGPVGGEKNLPTLSMPALSTAEVNVKSLRTSITQRRLSAMLADTAMSFLESVLTTIVMSTFAVIAKGFSIISAHRILILVLAFSAATNILLGTRSSIAFWHERRANSIIHAIRATPDGTMMRIIRLQDLEEVVHNGTDLASVPTGECYNKFRERVAGRGSGLSRRIQSSREGLGGYRNDLVVALRVVNRLEREFVNAEWEDWVAGEVERCNKFMGYIETGELKEQLGGYCGSCGIEWESIAGSGI